MKLNQILTISGKPGLYQLQSRTRSGFLALSLLDQKRISIGLRNNVSLLFIPFPKKDCFKSWFLSFLKRKLSR